MGLGVIFVIAFLVVILAEDLLSFASATLPSWETNLPTWDDLYDEIARPFAQPKQQQILCEEDNKKGNCNGKDSGNGHCGEGCASLAEQRVRFEDV